MWIKSAEVAEGDTVMSYDATKCIEVLDVERTGAHNDVVRIHGLAYASMAAVVPDEITFDWPAQAPIWRMRPNG